MPQQRPVATGPGSSATFTPGARARHAIIQRPLTVFLHDLTDEVPGNGHGNQLNGYHDSLSDIVPSKEKSGPLSRSRLQALFAWTQVIGLSRPVYRIILQDLPLPIGFLPGGVLRYVGETVGIAELGISGTHIQGEDNQVNKSAPLLHKKESSVIVKTCAKPTKMAAAASQITNLSDRFWAF